jgi:hypothetical protein
MRVSLTCVLALTTMTRLLIFMRFFERVFDIYQLSSFLLLSQFYTWLLAPLRGYFFRFFCVIHMKFAICGAQIMV